MLNPKSIPTNLAMLTNAILAFLKPRIDEAIAKNDPDLLHGILPHLEYTFRVLKSERYKYIEAFGNKNEERRSVFGIHQRFSYILGEPFMGDEALLLGYGDNDSLIKRGFVVVPKRKLYGFGFLFSHEGKSYYALTAMLFEDYRVFAIMEVTGRSQDGDRFYLSHDFMRGESNSALWDIAVESQHNADFLPFNALPIVDTPARENSIFL